MTYFVNCVHKTERHVNIVQYLHKMSGVSIAEHISSYRRRSRTVSVSILDELVFETSQRRPDLFSPRTDRSRSARCSQTRSNL